MMMGLHMMTRFKYSRYFLTKSLEKLFVPARDQNELSDYEGEIKKCFERTGCN